MQVIVLLPRQPLKVCLTKFCVTDYAWESNKKLHLSLTSDILGNFFVSIFLNNSSAEEGKNWVFISYNFFFSFISKYLFSLTENELARHKGTKRRHLNKFIKFCYSPAEWYPSNSQWSTENEVLLKKKWLSIHGLGCKAKCRMEFLIPNL